MKDGFILLHRKLRNNILWPKNKPFSKMEAWIDLLMMARFDQEPKKVLLGNEVVFCGRGQIVRSINTYQKRWNWGAQRVKSFFEILLKLKQIEKKTTTKTTIITICNYDSYQGKQQTDNKPIINEKQTDNKRITIKNKVNNDNKVNNNITDEIRNFTNSLLIHFPENIIKKLSSSDTNNLFDTIDKLMRLDKFNEEQIKIAVKYARANDFWQTNFLSLNKLRKKNRDGIKYIDVFLEKSNNKFYDKPKIEQPEQTEDERYSDKNLKW